MMQYLPMSALAEIHTKKRIHSLAYYSMLKNVSAFLYNSENKQILKSKSPDNVLRCITWDLCPQSFREFISIAN